MIGKEDFVQIIQEHNNQHERIDKLCDITGFNIWESDLIEYGNLMFDKVIEAYFTEEGVDWIFWWLYERDGNPDMKAYNENDNEIPFATIEDLWNYVKQYRK